MFFVYVLFIFCDLDILFWYISACEEFIFFFKNL